MSYPSSFSTSSREKHEYQWPFGNGEACAHLHPKVSLATSALRPSCVTTAYQCIPKSRLAPYTGGHKLNWWLGYVSLVVTVGAQFSVKAVAALFGFKGKDSTSHGRFPATSWAIDPSTSWRVTEDMVFLLFAGNYSQWCWQPLCPARTLFCDRRTCSFFDMWMWFS